MFSAKTDFYNLGHFDELEDAQMKNNNPSRIFQKTKAVFSFNGSNRSSQTSDQSMSAKESVSQTLGDVSNITPNFKARIQIVRSSGNSQTPPSLRSNAFKNQLTEKAEFFIRQKEKINDNITVRIDNIFGKTNQYIISEF